MKALESHFPDFFCSWRAGVPGSQHGTDSEVQRGGAHSKGGTWSYRKDAAPKAIDVGDFNIRAVFGNNLRFAWTPS